jgi:VWFA-related protein
MDSPKLRVCTLVWIVTIAAASHALIFAGQAQKEQKPGTEDPVRLNASLVQVPALVTDKAGKFVTDLSQGDFTVSEDGKRQEISLFAAVKQPFNAVLVIDTSNSTQDRLRAIQSAAVDFTKQLRPGDRMMVISFDNEVKQLTEFTEDRSELESNDQSYRIGFWKVALRSDRESS